MTDIKTETAKPTVETATTTARILIDSLTNDVVQLKKTLEKVQDDNKGLTKQNLELCTIVESTIKADTIAKIMAKSNYKQAELEPMQVEQLQQIEANLSRIKGADTVSYKPIRTGNDSDMGRTTVGNLYGKTKEQILAMQGEF